MGGRHLAKYSRAVLILLPPSEGKTAPVRGRPLDLAGLSRPELNPARDKVLAALIGLCAGDAERARQVLGLTPGQAGEVARNAGLRQAPAAAAAKVYTGVLYEALDFATLGAAGQRYARKNVVVFSALWGMVGLADRIPAYRCSPGMRLPGLGVAAGAWWRRELPAVQTGQFVVDLRSGPYAGMWRPGRAATVRVLHDGKVVSHFNKATKGRLVRDLAQAGVTVANTADGTTRLAAALRDLKYDVRVDGDVLDVVVDTLI